MDKILVFEIWGDYAHFKKIYATTSAVSYVIPPKTTIYGYISAMLGLSKEKNEYLNSFKEGSCLIGLQIMNPIIMQRINTNLRAVLGRMKPNGNRKPTMVEYVYQPKYRLYFHHIDSKIYNQLKNSLVEHTSVYTPSLGLANLISNFKWVGEYSVMKKGGDNIPINSVIPRSKFIQFDIDGSITNGNEIVEVSQFSVEMDNERNVTKRDDILLDRKGKPINASVKEYYQVDLNEELINVMLF